MDFVRRHIGPSSEEISSMLKFLNVESLEDLILKGVPREVLNTQNLNLPSPLTESELIDYTRKQATKNKTFKNYIGQGYYECLPLSVTNRNIIKNPVWYTAYTPYQAELAQGRLEALLNFQTMICDLTGMDLSNASLLDESTACAEAMFMVFNSTSSESKTLFVNDSIWDQTLTVLKTRAKPLGIQIQKGSLLEDEIENVFAVFLQYPFSDGSIPDLKNVLQKLKGKNIPVLVSVDLLAYCLLEPLKEVSVVVGSTGRLGMPLMYGGPHASFLAVKKQYASQIPGRIVGVSKDRDHNSALRLALQTREQHIRREKATSNICTSQVLPAVLSSMYVVYHGPEGLKSIAREIHSQVLYLYENLKSLPIINSTFFDTLSFQLNSEQQKKIKILSEAKGVNLGYSLGNLVNISVGEGRTHRDMDELAGIFKQIVPPGKETKAIGIPKSLTRKSSFLNHPVFHKYHSETKLIRYIHYLQGKDLTLTHSMIPLGSCTMKLSATTELQPMTWKPFSDIHPFAPLDQVQGSLEIFEELEGFLCEITGFSKISLQPNAGSQGEYAGLIIFRKYHESIGEKERDICLIPSSAHGTNPASARMAGLKVVIVRCNAQGGIDWGDLNQKVKKHSGKLSCLMLTYPSTCGVFEENISQISQLVHKHGGLVYFDGANMNALTGFCRPALLGVDAGHLNLHKTFCIPHGGGGPGAGPIGVVKKLEKFMPSHPFLEKNKDVFTISSVPYGNAGVLSISWAYIRMMGFEGLRKASQTAILNANYIKKKLESCYRILFTGLNRQVAHECILDFRKFKYSAEIDVVDVAKRLMDYGFHSPTMSWPVPGTLMIEPTESEDREELDRFCSSLIAIRKEIEEIEKGKADKKNNLLKNAPHTIQDLCKEKWDFPYSKKQACFPLPYLIQKKFWPSVSRIQEAYGDIHLFCSCPPVENSSSDTPSVLYNQKTDLHI